MKEIKLSQGKFALVDDSDYEWLSQWRWHAVKSQRGLTHYAGRNVIVRTGVQRIQKMHRLILGISDPKMQVDHIDGNGLNNQRANLRACTALQNAHNTLSRGGRSRFKGVFFHVPTKLWSCKIRIGNGRRLSGGYHKSEIDAAIEYDRMAILHHGEFAKLNVL